MPGSVLWRTATNLCTPLVPDDYIAIFAPLATRPRSGDIFRGLIEAIQHSTADAAELTLRVSRGWPSHRPGQYIRVGVDVDGVRLWRAYSITSDCGDEGRIKITVKAMPEGKVSGYLVHRIKPGALVQLAPPTGDFVMPEPLPRSVLFITAGSGITPVVGMLRNHQWQDVAMVHSSPTAADFIHGDEVRAANLRLIEQHTDRDGLLSPQDIARLVPDWDQRQTWACGPIGMLNDLELYWAERGVLDRLHTERFRPSFVAPGDGGRVRFSSSDRAADANGATALLDVGEGAGVRMPSGCRMGICYGCVLPLTSGQVRDLRTGALTTAEPGDSIAIQTCINAAAGDCVLKI